MAARKPSPRALKEARKETSTPRLKVGDAISGLQTAIAGKDKFAEVLAFNDEAVFGHVRNVVSTGCIGLDTALGIGGLPFGRLVEVFGAEQTGKTTFTDHVMANVQRMGGVAMVMDSEFKKDKAYSAAIGVDTSKLLAIEPPQKTLESAIETTRRACEYWIAQGTKIPLVIVLDSIAGLPTSEEIENPDTKQPGVAARELRRAMRQLIGRIARAQALLLVTNQKYEKIGGFSPTPGVKYSTYGGGGIRYHASIRVETIRTGTLKRSDGAGVGIEGILKVMKSGVGIPRDAPFAIEWGRGFSNAWSVLEGLKDARYVTSGGGRYTFSAAGLPPFQWQGGWQGLQAAFDANPELWKTMAGIFQKLPPVIHSR